MPEHKLLPWAEQMLAHADRGECWPWPFGTKAKGYGKWTKHPAGPQAHRVLKALDGDPIPDGLVARHLCHVRHCVNPDHVVAGTAFDNVDDARRAGRLPLGADTNSAKLTDDDVIAIRGQAADGRPTQAIAAAFGISQRHARDVIAGRYWQHIAAA